MQRSLSLYPFNLIDHNQAVARHSRGVLKLVGSNNYEPIPLFKFHYFVEIHEDTFHHEPQLFPNWTKLRDRNRDNANLFHSTAQSNFSECIAHNGEHYS